MIMSMTGYGRSVKENDNCKVSVEMKAVNHRFCEMSIRMPRQLFFLEDRIKKRISRFVKRGKVDVFLNFQGEGMTERSLSVDWNLFKEYQRTYELMATENASPESFPFGQLLLHEDVVTVEESDMVSKDLETMVQSAVDEATVQLVSMREHEGKELYHDIVKRLNDVTKVVAKLSHFAPQVQREYRERLIKRVNEFIYDRMEIDDSRILTEVAVYADKANIDEELTRIESHIKQFFMIMNDSEVVGRKLDFLVQELNREINTIGSKANHLEMSHLVVHIKAELEKIKEQVQNVE